MTRRVIELLKPDTLLLLAVITSALLAIHHSSRLVAVRYQIDYGEGLMMDGAMRLRHAQALYSDPFAFPVVLHVYGPVAYAAVASVLAGGEPHSQREDC